MYRLTDIQPFLSALLYVETVDHNYFSKNLKTALPFTGKSKYNIRGKSNSSSTHVDKSDLSSSCGEKDYLSWCFTEFYDSQLFDMD